MGQVPASPAAQAAPRAPARQAGGQRGWLTAIVSLSLSACLLLALVLSIAIVHRPEIGRALESGSLLARSTRGVSNEPESPPVSSPTSVPGAASSSSRGLLSPTASISSPRSPAADAATFTVTPLPPATVEPSPTPVPATATPRPIPTPIPLPTSSPPTRLVIPSIQLDTPVRSVGPVTVVREGKKMVIWDTLHDVASFHDASAHPGTGGNIVINGHRDIHGAVFMYLNKVRRGDEIVLYVDELVYRYEVVDILKLPYVNASAEQMADQLRLLGPTTKERVTILTCTPVGKATHRLYVLAEPVSGNRDDLRAR